ncbi:M23 family metallopeptidase [bacterium NHP-B]|nr:M23 family metallopeptidase [bacterium NHP-B]
MKGAWLCVMLLVVCGCQMSPDKAPLKLREGQVQVQEGDTIYTLSRQYNISPRQLMEINNLPSAVVTPGEVLLVSLPKTARSDRYAPLSEGESAVVKSEIDAAPAVEVVTAEAAVLPEIAEIEKRPVDYLWPLRGSVVVPFGKAKGAQALGILVEASSGTAVKAAKSGEVIYAGGDLKEYGQMVLMRHEDGSVTAYGHLEDVDVKQGDTLNQGQPMGTLSEVKPGSHKGRLYFELRKSKEGSTQKPKAVNPLPHLSS